MPDSPNSPVIFADANDIRTMIETLMARHKVIVEHIAAAVAAGRDDAAALLAGQAADIEARLVRWASYE